MPEIKNQRKRDIEDITPLPNIEIYPSEITLFSQEPPTKKIKGNTSYFFSGTQNTQQTTTANTNAAKYFNPILITKQITEALHQCEMLKREIQKYEHENQMLHNENKALQKECPAPQQKNQPYYEEFCHTNLMIQSPITINPNSSLIEQLVSLENQKDATLTINEILRMQKDMLRAYKEHLIKQKSLQQPNIRLIFS